MGTVTDENELVAVIVACAYDDLVEMRYMFVAPGYRRRGIAKGLLHDFLDTVSTNYELVSVFATFFDLPQYSAFKSLLKSEGCFLLRETGRQYLIRPNNLIDNDNVIKLIRRGAGQPRDIHTFEELPSTELRKFLIKLDRKAVPYTYHKGDVIEKISCYRMQDMDITTAVVFSRVDDHTLEIEVLYTEDWVYLALVLGRSFYLLQRHYSDYDVTFVSTDEATNNFFIDLFSGRINYERLIYARWNGLLLQDIQRVRNF